MRLRRGRVGDPRCRPDHVAVIHNGSSRCRSTDHPPMLLTISTTHAPATDLGFLLHKNPASVQSRELSFGVAHVLYPEASAERCTAALVLDVDPVSLIRGPSAASSGVEEYVNDRPYVASSFMSVAIAQLFGTAMNGNSKERPELAATAIPLEARASRRAVQRWRGAACARCSSRSATGGRHAARARRAVPGVGRRPVRLDRLCGRRSASPICCRTSTCSCPCSTTASTTGSSRRRSRSCCAAARAGSTAHPSSAS